MNKRVKRGRMVLLGEGYPWMISEYCRTVGIKLFARDPIPVWNKGHIIGPKLMKEHVSSYEKVRLYAEIIPQGRKKQ